ncbi:universal stress protein [Kitasatospora viridis]|uniref:Nucleotide-binding universal stress UspA family protein n=1 Tax=Kitasatospora viridis TaxID=281105 RepID=A0A561UN84_9ACTN|nr:universal stress protein [Kitasatospora viridis]TWG00825.1 nucleotide-binding universal stress UspA family protein [Kitasatospora viridis]
METGEQFELGTDGPTTLLVAVDGSVTSLRAAAYAAGLARRQGSRLVAVYVQTVGALAGTSAYAAQALREGAEETAAELRGLVEQAARDRGVRAGFVSRTGDPFTEIAALADEVRADGVLVGCSEKLGHRLLGSLAVRLVRAGRWPVTVVP